MISKQDFVQIDIEVKEALDETLDFMKTSSLDHDYILFIADGEFDKKLANSGRYNPYTIDNRMDRYKDETRLDFFVDFMRNFYAFGPGVNQTDDHPNRVTMELMVYCHIWEAKPFLKQLFKIGAIVDGDSYPWKVEVPEMTRHKYIRDIRSVLENHHLKLAEIIRRGFHSSLRNAFAHSEFQFDNNNRLIWLDTYKGDPTWDIENISYDDWSRRFAYSTMLSYHLLNKRFERRKSLVQDFGTDEFLIIHPIAETRFRTARIYYDEKSDSFSFHRRKS